MLLMVEKGLRGGICQAAHKCAKPNNKYMKNYDKKNWIIISRVFGWKQFVWMGNSQKIPVNAFKWV